MENSLKSRKIKYVTIAVIGIIAALVTIYFLKRPSVTMEAPLYCGYEEAHTEACYGDVVRIACGLEEDDGHFHTDECYEHVPFLACGLEETEGHAHGPDCYVGQTVMTCDSQEPGHVHNENCFSLERVLVCTLPEVPAHHHDESCYEYEDRLICTIPEHEAHHHTEECVVVEKGLICGKEVHQHTLQCFSDPSADVETGSVWARVTAIDFSGDLRTDLVSVAKTQMGYTESTRNYLVADDGVTIKGYSRFGDSFGDPYGDWSVWFCGFCLNYAGADAGMIPASSDASAWMAKLERAGRFESAAYVPSAGDVVFLSPDRCGMICTVTDGAIKVIEGDRGNCVALSEYSLTDPIIIGYGVLDGDVPAPELIGAEPENGPDQEVFFEMEPEEELVPEMLMAGDPSADIFYSPDLSNFVTSVSLTDWNGETVGEDGTVYLGEKYHLSVSFSEVGTTGQEKQFAYNGDGELTYQFDTDRFKFDRVTTGVIRDANDVQIGEYTIGTDGLLKVKMYYLDENGDVTTEPTELNIIDKSSTVSIVIDVVTEVTATENEEQITVDFGDDVVINVSVNNSGELYTNKTALLYNEADRSVEYAVETGAKRGFLEHVTFEDVPELTVDSVVMGSDAWSVEGMTIKHSDGSPVLDGEGEPVTSLEQLNALDLSLSAGEGFIIKYKIKLDDGVTTEGLRFTGKLDNVFTTTGTPPATPDDPVTAADDTTTPFNVWNLNKNGGTVEIELPEGGTKKLIKWYVTAGNYVDQTSDFTDTLGEGLRFYTGIEPEYTIAAPEKKTGTLAWQTGGDTGAAIDPDDPSKVVFHIPEDGTRVQIIYYTEFLKGDGNYTNTVDVPPYPSQSSTISITGSEATIFKEHYDEDGEYIYYRITAEIPAPATNDRRLRIQDLLNTQGYINICNYPEQMQVFIINGDGSQTELLPYGTGEGQSDVLGEYFYLMVRGTARNQVNSEGTFHVLFEQQDYPGSGKWPFDEKKTVIITYAIPKSAKSGLNNDPITGRLNSGNDITNTASVIAGDKTVAQDKDVLRRVSDIAKNGKITGPDEGIVSYKAAIPNTRRDGDEYFSTLQSNYTGMYIVDDFDDRMSYVPGSMKAYLYPRPTRGDVLYNLTHDEVYYSLQATFAYNGEIPEDAGSFTAYLSDFTLESCSIKYNRVDDYSGYDSLEDVIRQYPDAFAIVIGYDLKVRDEYMSVENAQQEMQLKNAVRFGYTVDSADYISFPAYETIPFTNKVIEKTSGALNADDTLDFTITVNTQGRDLTDQETVLIADTMSSSLTLYLNTVLVETKPEAEGGWTELESAAVIYDAEQNVLSVRVPDDVPVRITYTCKVSGDPDQKVSISNSASIVGYASCTKTINAEYTVNGTGSGGGDYSSCEVYVLKQDELTLESLSGARFALYGPYLQSRVNRPPEGVSATLEVGGDTLYFYREIETAASAGAMNGTFTLTDTDISAQGHYALLETKAPQDHIKTSEIYDFFMLARPEGGSEEIRLLEDRGTLTIGNRPIPKGDILPATGGIGLVPVYAAGILLMAASAFLLIRKRRKQDT